MTNYFLKQLFDQVIADKNYSQIINVLAKQNVSGTTITAYRKIHSLLTSVIERALAILDIPDINRLKNELTYISMDLVKNAILINYQSQRDLFNKSLAKGLSEIVKTVAKDIHDTVRKLSEDNRDELISSLKEKIIVLKMIIDGILALHYNDFKK